MLLLFWRSLHALGACTVSLEMPTWWGGYAGVTVGGNVGANLRMHPATVVTATFPKVQAFNDCYYLPD